MDSPPLRRRDSLIAAGFTDHELARAVRTGELTKIRRGSYLQAPEPDEATDQHLFRVRSAFPDLSTGTVVSHASAAVLHGLPIWSLSLERVQVTKRRAYGGRRRAHLHVRVATLRDDEVECIDGVLVTSAARTVVDVARSVPFEAGVTVGDAALALGLTTAEELARALRDSTHRPGSARARRVIAFADGRSESVGESRSRVAIARAGLPAPHLQWEVWDAEGELTGRTDFCWPEHGLVGEFDGQVKYGRLLRPGESAGDAVYREKLREDAIRALGYHFERWGWRHLNDFRPVAHRIRARL